MKRLINEEKDCEKIIIEPGDLFFVDSSMIGSWNAIPKKFDSNKHFKLTSYMFQNKDALDDNCLLVVKYLGKGIFEEMLSGKKILSCTVEGVMELDKDSNTNNISCELGDIDDIRDNCTTENFYAYLDRDSLGYYEPDISSIENYKGLLDVQKMMDVCPFTIHEYESSLYSINDASKALYLNHNDSERINILDELSFKANQLIEKSNKVVKNELNKELSSDIQVGYLENQLFDYSNEKARKLTR